MIGIASDHAGYKTKEEILNFLSKEGFQIEDYGTYDENSTDYPLYAIKIGNEINSGKIEKGILICKTGIGMCIAANKVKGIRCGKIETEEEAKLSREHNDCNVAAISALNNIEDNKKIILEFLKTPFSNGERHTKRIKIITDYESK